MGMEEFFNWDRDIGYDNEVESTDGRYDSTEDEGDDEGLDPFY
jgi:hypothetical protein